MAITVSGLYVIPWKNSLNGTATSAFNFTLATYKIALYSNSATPNFSSDTAYSATNEVSGTGWAAGGVLLSAAAAGATSTAPTLTESPTGSLMYDMGDISVSTTTLTNARGLMIYADPNSPKGPVVMINFAADYSTVAGTMGVQFAAAGVFAIDLTP